MIICSGKMKYADGFKYWLKEQFWIETPVRPDKDIITPFVRLYRNGLLTVEKGFAYDGASGPTYDSKSSMRASLVHDALYRLMQEGELARAWQPVADKLFYDICVADGMWQWRAKIWYWAVRRYGWKSTCEPKKIEVAP